MSFQPRQRPCLASIVATDLYDVLRYCKRRTKRGLDGEIGIRLWVYGTGVRGAVDVDQKGALLDSPRRTHVRRCRRVYELTFVFGIITLAGKQLYSSQT